MVIGIFYILNSVIKNVELKCKCNYYVKIKFLILVNKDFLIIKIEKYFLNCVKVYI